MYNHVPVLSNTLSCIHMYSRSQLTPYQLTKSKQKRFAPRMLKLDLKTGLTLPSKLNSLFSTFKSFFKQNLYTLILSLIFSRNIVVIFYLILKCTCINCFKILEEGPMKTAIKLTQKLL